MSVSMLYGGPGGSRTHVLNPFLSASYNHIKATQECEAYIL